MAFDRVTNPRIADTIVRQMERMILEGLLKPGEKLPAERELSKQLSVSRPSLREALQKLEAKGLLETRHGGGSYVKDVIVQGFSDPLMALLKEHPETSRDLLEFRRGLEGIAAGDAAIRATDADREIMRRRFKAMEEAHGGTDPGQEADADAQFHLSIAAAAHNVVLYHVMRGLFDLMKGGIAVSRELLYEKEGVRERLLSQHRELYEAVAGGDPAAARRAAEAHLSYVDDTLREIETERLREDQSRKRLEKLGN